MEKAEMMQRLGARIDADAHFRNELGVALESGVWQVVANLVAKAIGYVIDHASDIWDWLTDLFD